MSITAVLTTNKRMEFVGNPIRFDASGSTGDIITYVYDFDDVYPITTSATSADYSYVYYGERTPSLTVFSTSASNSSQLPYPIVINPHPYISLNGNLAIYSPIQFTDSSSPYYVPDTIDQATFDFGDGSPVVSGAPFDIFTHTYSAVGNFNATLAVYDISGNSSYDSRIITIFGGSAYSYEQDYISLCGPELRRFGECKSINLTRFLPDYLQETDVFTLTEFFENYLNEMYSGLCGFQMQQTQINASATKLTFSASTQNLSTDPRISILEKIKRLADLHDPDLIDIDYIQFFAKYLGYNVEISRNEIGGFGSFDTSTTVCSASDNEKYLRFMVSNLPNWYKIKTTNDMISVMLYSFGLIGNIAQYYTKPIAQGGYDQNLVNWKLDDDNNLATIPKDWFPTPHYSVKVDIDKSIGDNPDASNILNILMTEGDKIIRAMESVRPINDVFHNLTAITTEYIDVWAGAITRLSRYMRIESDGPADWWVV
jgi:hypothetical protein